MGAAATAAGGDDGAVGGDGTGMHAAASLIFTVESLWPTSLCSRSAVEGLTVTGNT